MGAGFFSGLGDVVDTRILENIKWTRANYVDNKDKATKMGAAISKNTNKELSDLTALLNKASALNIPTSALNGAYAWATCWRTWRPYAIFDGASPSALTLVQKLLTTRYCGLQTRIAMPTFFRTGVPLVVLVAAVLVAMLLGTGTDADLLKRSIYVETLYHTYASRAKVQESFVNRTVSAMRNFSVLSRLSSPMLVMLQKCAVE